MTFDCVSYEPVLFHMLRNVKFSTLFIRQAQTIIHKLSSQAQDATGFGWITSQFW
jgi:hypothetical protein